MNMLPSERIRLLRDMGLEYEAAWRIGMSPGLSGALLLAWRVVAPEERSQLVSNALNMPKKIRCDLDATGA